MAEEEPRADQRVDRLGLHADRGVDGACAFGALEEEKEGERGAERADRDQNRSLAALEERRELAAPDEKRDRADRGEGARAERDREAAECRRGELGHARHERAVGHAVRGEEQARALGAFHEAVSGAVSGAAFSNAATAR
ncbi:MAG: hypothetical protein FJ108_14115 [Deltaproteobacteria bacterium]|nr:hypothetical protein [Deltaproteobacteria bacterium]